MPDGTDIASPVPNSQFYGRDGAKVSREQLEEHEYAGIVAYWWRGRL